MTMTDPLGDMLTRIRNGASRRKSTVSTPASRLRVRVLDVPAARVVLTTFTRNLADSLGRDKVRVNHFNVGWVLSPNEYKLKVSEGLPPDWPERPPRCRNAAIRRGEPI